MVTLLRRLTRFALAFAFVAGTLAQLAPGAMAVADVGACSDMPAACGAPPCSGHGASCIDHLGCITTAALPTPAIRLAVILTWTLPAYEEAAKPLSGLSVEPELAPPILAA